MKTSLRESIVLHELIRTMEELSSGFQKRGVSKQTADAQGLIAAFMIAGWSRVDAEKFVSEYMPYNRSNGDQQ